MLALSLNSAGYLAEILAGAMRLVPRGEIEAATAAGFGRLAVLRHVLAPHTARLALRSYGNEIVFVIKGTSVASLVTVRELLANANQVYFNTFDPDHALPRRGRALSGARVHRPARRRIR